MYSLIASLFLPIIQIKNNFAFTTGNDINEAVYNHSDNTLSLSLARKVQYLVIHSISKHIDTLNIRKYYTAEQVDALIQPLIDRITALEAKLTK